MERLLSSSSSSLLPSRVFSKSRCPFPPRLGRVDSPWLFRVRTVSRRVGSVSCSNEAPDPGSMSSMGRPPPVCARRVDPVTGSGPARQFRQQNAMGDSWKGKAISSGTFVLLSAIIVALIHPLFASPAFATFQNAAKTGGPAAATAVGKSLARTELLSSAWTGFFAGCLHTLSGPDHLAALAPLSIGRTKLESAAVGALWGCGHDAGQVIFGLLFLLLKDRLHIEVIRTWGTRVVGLTLLVIGAMGIREASEVPTPCVALENGECDVSVYESIDSTAAIGGQKKKKKKIGLATFATGIIHGLQPDALLMVLPALALPSRWAGAAFLVMFLVGTVVAMGSYTVFLGSCSEALKDRVPRITEKLTWASSLVAIGLGFAILVSQLFGYSLY
ncbi:hypothetical protein SAY86_009518 [Trapa natans]|uniref:Urease accessory protein UreH-like transmembrane domain-containing protein n=2 Tax=Trapa TaxID=22665 RepID=A0AAN7KR26_TRANT|nr:hypothetical protein SAY86_009518 [Trapa natans]